MSFVFPFPSVGADAVRRHVLLWLAVLTFAAGAPTAEAAARTGELRTAQPKAQAALADGVQIQPALMKRLDAGGREDFVVEFKERADLSAAAAMDWQARGRYVVEQLRATADRSQAALRRDFARQGVDFESHWIKNVILVRNGDAATVQAASAHPGVARIRELPRAQIVRPEPGRKLSKADKAGIGVADNIAWIGADTAWAQGTRGNGVTVGVIDTGAYYTHNALRRQYRGWLGGDSYEHDYNWFAPSGDSEEPSGADTHGSHVIGTIAGDDMNADPAERNRIGVAPGARWIACMGLVATDDNTSNLLGCGEFMLAPTRTDGSDPDPDKRPQVVNNSWAENNCNGEATSFYADVIDAWVAAGIFPVFAAGNTSGCWLPEPPGLSTVSSPASHAASFAVGSTGNHDGTYATHSLWGPTSDASPGLPTLPDPRGYPQLKPQVVAPGVDIVSAYDGFEDDYGTMTGTSMSAPHVSGVMALMLEAGECLVGDYATVGTLLMSTARPLPYATGGDPAPGPGDIPNYATGWGEIDAAAAVDAAAAACGPQGFIAGHITGPGGAPVGGARVELFVDENVRVWELTSEPDGSYIRRLPENLGSGYTLRVSAYGYVTETQAGITVTDDQTTPVDVQLAAAPMATVSGQVTDATTGWPLHARLRIAGYPGEAIWTDATDGSYSLQLPTGASYRFDIDSDIPGYQPATAQIAVAGALAQDFPLAADTTACTAPGYAYTQQLLSENFESGSPPTGWSISSAGEGWLFGTHAELNQPLYWPIPARAGRFAATIDPGIEGGRNDARYDYLVSPPIDLGAATLPVVRFDSLFWSGSFLTRGAYVEASTDDGATWAPVGVPPQDALAWRGQAMSLAAFAGQTVRVRFHYDDSSTDTEDMVNPGWAVDDVAVVGGCAAPASGGLVVGHVTDANTGTALDGAAVSVGSETTTTVSSDDAAVGAGFFAVWADSGSATVAASRGTQPQGYGDAEATVAVADGTTASTTLALPAGQLVLDPAPTATLELGTTRSVPFNVRNDGTLPLQFAFEGVALEEHFDDGVPPAGWTLADNGQGCPWGVFPFGNSAGGDGNSAGIYPYDCWGAGRLDNTMELPAVDLSASATASLGFFLGLHQGPGSDSVFDVEASTDGGASWTAVYSLDEDTFHLEPFNLVEVDLSAFAGEADVRVRFRYRTTPPWGEIQVDQIHLFRSIGIDDPMTIAPATGTLAPGASLAAAAQFDATRVAQPGTYDVPVLVVEDTPYAHPFGDVIATMTVTAPASFGSIAGTVRSLGRCEAAPEVLAGVPLRIVAADGGEVATTTDEAGQYRYWIDAARSPFTVHVAADGHVATEATASIGAGAETTLDIDARLTAACLVPDPVALEVSVSAGEQATLPLDLLNLGPVDGGYAARIGGDPTVATAIRLSQNESPDPEAFATFGCFDPATGYGMESRWYRVFPLAERHLAGDTAWIDGVRFGADSTFAAKGTQDVRVAVHALEGPFVLSNLTLLASVDAQVQDTALGMLEASFATPVQVPVDAVVVVEISVGDGAEAGSIFFPAGNFAADSAPGWFQSEPCGFMEPTSYDDVGFETLSPIIELDVRASDACGALAAPVGWLAVSPADGTVAGDGAATLQAAFDAATTTQGSHHGAICISAPGPIDADTQVPARLNVDAPGSDAIFASGFED